MGLKSGGRPPKGRRLTHRLSVPVCSSELEELQRLCELAGVSLSVYLRLAALDCPLPRPVPIRNRQALPILARLAGNLSQLGFSLSYGTPGAVSAAQVWELARLARSVRKAVAGVKDDSERV